jgi:hypothetical protein
MLNKKGQIIKIGVLASVFGVLYFFYSRSKDDIVKSDDLRLLLPAIAYLIWMIFFTYMINPKVLQDFITKIRQLSFLQICLLIAFCCNNLRLIIFGSTIVFIYNSLTLLSLLIIVALILSIPKKSKNLEY